MNPQDLRNLQESYLDIYEESLVYKDPNRLAQMMGARLKRETKRNPDNADKKTKQYLEVVERLRRRAGPTPEGHLAEPSKYFRRGYAMGVKKEDLDLVLDYLLDEGYTDCIGSAEIILENMSDEWLDEILNEAKWGKQPLPIRRMKDAEDRYSRPGQLLTRFDHIFRPEHIKSIRQEISRRGGRGTKPTNSST